MADVGETFHGICKLPLPLPAGRAGGLHLLDELADGSDVPGCDKLAVWAAGHDTLSGVPVHGRILALLRYPIRASGLLPVENPVTYQQVDCISQCSKAHIGLNQLP